MIFAKNIQYEKWAPQQAINRKNPRGIRSNVVKRRKLKTTQQLTVIPQEGKARQYTHERTVKEYSEEVKKELLKIKKIHTTIRKIKKSIKQL